MTRKKESLSSGGLFSLIPLMTMVFLGTAVILWWDPWGRAEPLRPYRPIDPDLTLPVLARADPKPILYYGSENCKGCHSKREYRKLWNAWAKGGHKDVECEACHGPAGDHALRDVDPRPKMVVTSEMLAKPHDLCMSCHAKIPGRQASVRQIECDRHLAEFKVKKGEPDYEESLQCLSCHDAHRPVKK